SRSSALASKATGYPIARVATLLALGYTLDELPNRITGTTVAAFEPSLDYVCVKVPRWAFEKFPNLVPRLTTRMQSIGEAMALGRTFPEALGKALRSTETRTAFLLGPAAQLTDDELSLALERATPERLYHIVEAYRRGWPRTALARATAWDPWFLDQIARMVDGITGVASCRGGPLYPSLLADAKALGLSDAELARAAGMSEEELGARRPPPAFRGVDTCAGEFEAATPYFYSAHGVASEGEGLGERAVLILGSGPNRIGQGLEFDTCCVSAVSGLRDEGLAAILLNCNPETVSTDFDTADRLYFEPVTAEDVLAVCERERPRGVIVGLGGQTPLKVAARLERSGVRILGTPPRGIALAEDRREFAALCASLGITVPVSRTAQDEAEALIAAGEIGYPLMLRPSFVLGGEGMAMVWNEEELRFRLANAVRVSAEHPLLIDRFLEDAVEVDFDVLTDSRDVHPCGALEHIEPAGIHSGDSMQVFPAQTISPAAQATMLEVARSLAPHLGAIGLMNLQFAAVNGTLYLLEVNPRASRTVPFLHKAGGVEWARLAARLMVGRSLAELRPPAADPRGRVWVKVPVFPFARFGVDPVLGPEMRSTGEALGSGPTLGAALTKAIRAAGCRLSEDGAVLVSLADRDKGRQKTADLAGRLAELSLPLFATRGTAELLARHGLSATVLDKIGEGGHDPVTVLRHHRVGLVLNTPRGGKGRSDAAAIRLAALQQGIPCMTTLEGGLAALEGLRALRAGELDIAAL
ncbi:MAG: carbamoyl-phosphate synthase large subunit, partial [Acidobacteriota bacterium]